MQTLADLYIDMLQDIWSANTQAETAIRRMSESATDARLKEALESLTARMSEQATELSRVIKDHGADPTAEHCKGMEGLVREAQAHAIDLDAPDAVKDASIIAQQRRLTHYRIAGYGTVVALAKELGHEDNVIILAEHLVSAREADEFLDDVARNQVNTKAA